MMNTIKKSRAASMWDAPAAIPRVGISSVSPTAEGARKLLEQVDQKLKDAREARAASTSADLAHFAQKFA